jgi:hypothetical protein
MGREDARLSGDVQVRKTRQDAGDEERGGADVSGERCSVCFKKDTAAAVCGGDEAMDQWVETICGRVKDAAVFMRGCLRRLAQV